MRSVWTRCAEWRLHFFLSFEFGTGAVNSSDWIPAPGILEGLTHELSVAL